jgi:FkbM family methyltransferase
LRFRLRQCKLKLREARWSIFLAGRSRSLLMDLKPGLKIRLFGDSELCRLIYYRSFEANERDFLIRFLRSGDVFIDVGANIGLFTLIAAKCVGPRGRVVAFEPTASTYDRLAGNVYMNGFANVDCIKLALSDARGRLRLARASGGFDAWNSLAEPAMGRSCESEEVEVVEWDDYAKERGLAGAVTMMKIDVEGWESRVLAGGRELLGRPDAPVLQMEFTDAAAEAAGSSCRALYQRLEDYGYRMFRYDPGRRRLVPEPRQERYPYMNLIAAKNADFVNARIGDTAATL